MLNRVIEWSIRNQFLVWIFVIGVAGAGIYAFLNIPIDALPDVSDVQVIVIPSGPGSAADRGGPGNLSYHHHDARGG